MVKKRRTGRGAPPLDAGVAEMRALAHPLRLRIMELFAEAPRTTKQVAELLGQPPTRLYHHVAALERAGLLRLKETRRNRGAVEKWYESISRTMSAARTGPARKSERSTRRALAMTVLEQSRQEVLHSLHAPVADAPLLARMVVVAPPERTAQIRQRMLALLQQIKSEFDMSDAASAGDCERWSMTLTLAPVWPRTE
jgi:DNA-binding transcriptional ArsR family regulator